MGEVCSALAKTNPKIKGARGHRLPTHGKNTIAAVFVFAVELEILIGPVLELVHGKPGQAEPSQQCIETKDETEANTRGDG